MTSTPPTSQPSAVPSVAPTGGTRVRAGNAMARTRVAVLDGASRAIIAYGSRRATMGDIAALGGVAKATLYNHFRRKAEVYSALAEAEIDHLAAGCARLAPTDLAGALTLAAGRVATHPAVRKIAADEPDVLAAMLTATEARSWALARSATAAVLSAALPRVPDGLPDLILRWVAAHLAVPGTEHSRTAGAALLAAAAAPGTGSGTATGTGTA